MKMGRKCDRFFQGLRSELKGVVASQMLQRHPPFEELVTIAQSLESIVFAPNFIGYPLQVIYSPSHITHSISTYSPAISYGSFPGANVVSTIPPTPAEKSVLERIYEKMEKMEKWMLENIERRK